MAAVCGTPRPAYGHAPPSSLSAATPASHHEQMLDERANHLASELRCLVCQNQTIADSTAPLARQLKAEVRHQLARGATDQQVLDFMAERYGDFVLYRPPVTPLTWLLWTGPLLLLGLGALLIGRRHMTHLPPFPMDTDDDR
ncbi:MAG TPA: cytochrome c-type biogenesis protein CcmH [Candidatus Aquabacterium excrementipullorum]|nr:cytochrome c-type biogenesis protein CcmH [Candidatus Aquabacterium excrementipullorum]